MTDQEKIELNKIPTRINYTLRERGDLETRNNDAEDFINIPVWELRESEISTKSIIDILKAEIQRELEAVKQQQKGKNDDN